MRRPHPIRWLREHPLHADLILASLLTAIVLVAHLTQPESVFGEGTVEDPTWFSPILAFGAIFPVAWRRVHPIAVALVVTGFDIVFTGSDFDGTGFLGPTIAIYSLGAHAVGRPRTRTLIAIATMIGLLFIAGLLVDELAIADFISSVTILVTAYVLGDNLRRRRAAADALVERAERAERERELVAQQRVAEERTRIARELHDVVAHSVSAMVIQAGAARRNLSKSPDNAEHALGNIEDIGRRTMNELRGILGVLRRTDDDTSERVVAPQPTLLELDALVRMSDDLPIQLSVSGELDDLPRSVALTAYRVVQEALTNTRRHAGPVESVEISITRDDGSLKIIVTDDGRGAAADDVGPGYGLVGMRERVHAMGGSVVTRPRVGGGWVVLATLPVKPTGPSASTTPRQGDAPRADRHADHGDVDTPTVVPTESIETVP